MEQLINWVEGESLLEFQQRARKDLGWWIERTDKLKAFVSLQLLAEETVKALRSMDLDGILVPLQEKAKEDAAIYADYLNQQQSLLKENKIVEQALSENGILPEEQMLHASIERLIRKQEELLRRAVKQNEQTSFEVIATRHGERK